MDDIGLLFVGAVFVNNLVLRGYGGRLPHAATATPGANAFVGLATAAVLVPSVALAWLVQGRLLDPAGLSGLRAFGLLLTIAAVALSAGYVMERRNPGLRPALAVLLPLVAGNALVFAVLLAGIDAKPTLFAAIASAAGVAGAFAIALPLFAAMRERLDVADVPAAWRGTPVALVAAGLMALALGGLGGMAPA